MVTSRKFGVFSKTYASAQRYRHILFILLKYGFEDLIDNLKIEQYLETRWNFITPRRSRHVDRLSRAERIRMVLEELGPTFVKMGQTMSTRSDVFPNDILAELVKLQDRVPPFPASQVKRIIEKELQESCDTLFSHFEEKPLAAGSIGQVHRATLMSGEKVAVKVQRPGIRPIIELDLEIMHDMARLMERHMELGQIHKPTRIVAEFAKTLRKELDYGIEAANVERFAAQFKDNPAIFVHKVYRAASTSRVITTGFVEGIKPASAHLLRQRDLNPEKIASKGTDLVMTQVFIHGFFHADPHPGNILVMNDEVICFLDFGMMGRLDRHSRELFADLLLNVVQANEVKAAEALLKLTHSHTLIDRLGLEREIAELIDQYLYRPVKELEVGKLIRSLLDLTVKHELSIPAHYFLLIKTITQIEDLGRNLDTEFDFTELAGPYIRKLLMNRYHPRRLARDLYETGTDLVYLVREVPGELRELLKQARQGKMKIEFEHLGLGPLLHTINHVSSQLASAIVLASLIVGSSLIVLSGLPPLWHQIPIIGLGGYLASAVMGILLLRSIWKNR